MMQETTYQSEIVSFAANRFQPDCCASLVYSWFAAMKISEENGIEWCRKAHAEVQHSAFYAHHIARTDLINGKMQLKAVQDVRQIGQIIAQVGMQNASSDMVQSAFTMISALDGPIQDLRNKKPEADAQQIMGFRVIRTWDTHIRANLDLCLKSLSIDKRFYMVSLKAGAKSHVIGFVSTKCEGWFSPNGYIYYFDPNLHRVVRFRSRSDVITFTSSWDTDYQGLNRLVQIGLL